MTEWAFEPEANRRRGVERQIGRPLATSRVFDFGATRHQKLHGHLRCDPALAHLLLDRFWQKLHQCQPS